MFQRSYSNLALCYTPEKERIADPDFEYVRDYAALNVAAVDAGMLTARDQARYRTLHDIKRKVYIRDVSLAKTTRKFPDDMVFGTPRRSTFRMFFFVVFLCKFRSI